MKLTPERIAEIHGNLTTPWDDSKVRQFAQHDLPDALDDLEEARMNLRSALETLARTAGKEETEGRYACWRRPGNIVTAWALDELVRHGWWERHPARWRERWWYRPIKTEDQR